MQYIRSGRPSATMHWGQSRYVYEDIRGNTTRHQLSHRRMQHCHFPYTHLPQETQDQSTSFKTDRQILVVRPCLSGQHGALWSEFRSRNLRITVFGVWDIRIKRRINAVWLYSQALFIWTPWCPLKRVRIVKHSDYWIIVNRKWQRMLPASVFGLWGIWIRKTQIKAAWLYFYLPPSRTTSTKEWVCDFQRLDWGHCWQKTLYAQAADARSCYSIAAEPWKSCPALPSPVSPTALIHGQAKTHGGGLYCAGANLNPTEPSGSGRK